MFLCPQCNDFVKAKAKVSRVSKNREPAGRIYGELESNEPKKIKKLNRMVEVISDYKEVEKYKIIEKMLIETRDKVDEIIESL